MAQWYRATLKVPHNSGVPRDEVQNTFAFVVPGTADRDLVAGEIDLRITGFYDDLGVFLSSQMDWAHARVSVVDMTDEQPRIPFYDEESAITASGTAINDLPAEVAVCLSFEGARASGVNMRRRRGRIYVGPLAVGSADQHMVQSGLYGLIATAGDDNLLSYSPRLSDLAVYSRYTHYGIPVGQRLTEDDEEIPDFLPASFTPAVRLWVDNAWDTQRRRGPRATARTTIQQS